MELRVKPNKLELLTPADDEIHGQLVLVDGLYRHLQARIPCHLFDVALVLVLKGHVHPYGTRVSLAELARLIPNQVSEDSLSTYLHELELFNLTVERKKTRKDGLIRKQEVWLRLPPSIQSIQVSLPDQAKAYLASRLRKASRGHSSRRKRHSLIEATRADLEALEQALSVTDMATAGRILRQTRLDPAYIGPKLSSKARTRLLAEIHMGRASYHMQRAEIAPAIVHSQKAIKYFEKDRDWGRVGGIETILCAAYRIDGNIESAWTSGVKAKQALDVETTSPMAKGIRSSVHSSTILPAIMRGDYAEANRQIQVSRTIAAAEGDINRLHEVILRKIKLHMALGDPEAAQKLIIEFEPYIEAEPALWLKTWLWRWNLEVKLKLNDNLDEVLPLFNKVWSHNWERSMVAQVRNLLPALLKLIDLGIIDLATMPQLRSQLAYMNHKEGVSIQRGSNDKKGIRHGLELLIQRYMAE